MTRSQAIRAFCRECNGVQAWTLANDCVSSSCALYPFRPGRGLPGQKKTQRGRRNRTVERNLE